MRRAFKTILEGERRRVLWSLAPAGVGFLIGALIWLCFWLAEDGEGPAGVVTLLTFWIGLLGLCICMVGELLSKYPVAIRMGMKRKNCLFAWFVADFLYLEIFLLLVWLLFKGERAVTGLLFDVVREPVDISLLFTPWLFIALPFAAACGIVLCVSGILRFKKWAAVILWAVWMFVCLAVPRMLSGMTGRRQGIWETAGKNIAGWFSELPAGFAAAMVLFVSAGAVLLGGYSLIKQDV